MPCVFLGYYEATKAYRLMCLETKRIIKSRDVIFIEGSTKIHGVLHPKKLENLVMNDDELVEDVNLIPLEERPTEDVEGNESTTNSSLEEEFAPTQDEGLNEAQQDGRRERPQRQQRKEWPHD
jgi:hypothetical protein